METVAHPLSRASMPSQTSQRSRKDVLGGRWDGGTAGDFSSLTLKPDHQNRWFALQRSSCCQ